MKTLNSLFLLLLLFVSGFLAYFPKIYWPTKEVTYYSEIGDALATRFELAFLALLFLAILFSIAEHIGHSLLPWIFFTQLMTFTLCLGNQFYQSHKISQKALRVCLEFENDWLMPSFFEDRDYPKKEPMITPIQGLSSEFDDLYKIKILYNRTEGKSFYIQIHLFAIYSLLFLLQIFFLLYSYLKKGIHRKSILM